MYAAELRVAVTTATTPSDSVVLFAPQTKQFKRPLDGLHMIDLPLLVNAEPAVTVIELNSLAEKVRLNCNEVALRLDAPVSVRLSATGDPTSPDPDANVRL